MEESGIGRLPKKAVKKIEKIWRKELNFLKKKHFVFLVLIFVFSTALVFVCGSEIKKSSLLAAAKNSNVYYGKEEIFLPARASLGASLDLTFLQDNTLLNISSPAIITPYTFGSIIGDSENFNSTGEILEYRVEEGDTVSSIAQKFNISSQTILWANNLSSSAKIKVGQKLIILPVSGVLYTVKQGDTLSDIAKRYKADVKKIIEYNGLSEEGDIYVGDSLIIPGGKNPVNINVNSRSLIPVADSYFLLPAQGKITQGLHYYNAIDVANNCGSPIIAVSDGIVQRAGWIKVGGQRVTILHSNGVVTYYGHLSKILVSPGQKVSSGDIIGYMGRTGYATGCHLHFQVIGAKNYLTKYPVGSYISWKK